MSYHVSPQGRFRRTESGGIVRRPPTCNGPWQSAVVHHWRKLMAGGYSSHQAKVVTIVRYQLWPGELAKWIAAEERTC